MYVCVYIFLCTIRLTVLSSSRLKHIEPNGSIICESWTGKDVEGSDRSFIWVKPRHLPGLLEKNCENLSGQLVALPSLELGTSWIQISGFAAWANFLRESYCSSSSNPSFFWLVGSFPSGIVCKPLQYNCQLLCLWRLASNIAVEVFPRPFFRILLLQGCLLQTRYAQLYALSMSGVYFLKFLKVFFLLSPFERLYHSYSICPFYF